jgi:hypothetical protein
VQRWNWRLYAYGFLLRDEYPPYSLRRDARPGNEVVSTVIGVPLFVGYFALTFVPIFAGGGGAETSVSLAAIEAGRPAELHAGSLRLEISGYDDSAGRSDDGLDLISFSVHAEKDGFWPTIYTPNFFGIDTVCGPFEEFETLYGAYEIRGDGFQFFWTGGDARSTVVFEVFPGEEPCALEYFNFTGTMRFNFTD